MRIKNHVDKILESEKKNLIFSLMLSLTISGRSEFEVEL